MTSAVTNLWLIVGLAAAVLVTVAALFALFRARAEADERVAGAVRQLAEGMQQTMRDLAEAYDDVHAHAVAPVVAELASSLDLDAVAERTLEEVVALPGVDAALVDAEGPEGERLTAAL